MNEMQDPYRAPTSSVAEPLQAIPLVTAGKGRRFLTFLIDYIGQFVLLMVVMVAAIIARPDLATSVQSMSAPMQWLLGIVALVAYYVIFEGLFARTPGKWICGTRVVDVGGGAPSLGQVLGRSFARLVPFEAFSVAFSDDADTRGWHDSWARTRVVRTR